MSAASVFINRRTNAEIKLLLDECIDGQRDRFPGKTYEDGVVYAFLWLFIGGAEHPLDIDAHIDPLLHRASHRALKDSALSRREEIERPLREEIEQLEARLNESKDEQRCSACGCATPKDAEARECGCDAPVCNIQRPETLATAYERLYAAQMKKEMSCGDVWFNIMNARDPDEVAEILKSQRDNEVKEAQQ